MVCVCLCVFVYSTTLSRTPRQMIANFPVLCVHLTQHVYHDVVLDTAVAFLILLQVTPECGPTQFWPFEQGIQLGASGCGISTTWLCISNTVYWKSKGHWQCWCPLDGASSYRVF